MNDKPEDKKAADASSDAKAMDDKKSSSEPKEEQKTEAPKAEKAKPEPKEKKSEVKLNDKQKKIVKEIESLSVLELADLVKALEDKFGVTASAPTAMATAPSEASAKKPKEEQTVFNVVLAEAGAQKIQVIKAVRELVPTLGLTDAKALVDSAPKPVLEGVNKAAAEEAKKKLEAAGGKVELK